MTRSEFATILIWVTVVLLGLAVLLHASVSSIGFVYDGI